MMASEELHKGAIGEIFNFARNLRKQQTQAEKILWSHLKNGFPFGFKFRRQHPIQNFIADFYCHKAGLIIEVDGKVHEGIEQRKYDHGRTYELQEIGLKVIRFRNEEVEENIGFVLDTIKSYLIPDPSPEGEGNREV